MKIAIVTDAWFPQTNGVVRTLATTADTLRGAGHDVRVIEPNQFRTFPCPDVSGDPAGLASRIAASTRCCANSRPTPFTSRPKATLGSAARTWCLRQRMPFTTSYHTQFPEYVRARAPIPLAVTYALPAAFSRRGAVARWWRRPHCSVSLKRAASATSCAGLAASTWSCSSRATSSFLRLSAAHRHVRRARRGGEEYRSLPGTRLARHESDRRRWTGAPDAGRRNTSRRSSSATNIGEELAQPHRRGRCLRVSKPHRYVRPGAAGSDGLRRAGGGVSGDRPDRCRTRMA